MDKNLAKTDAEALMQVGACQVSIPVDSNPFPVPQLPRDLFFLFIVANILSIFDCVRREARQHSIFLYFNTGRFSWNGQKQIYGGLYSTQLHSSSSHVSGIQEGKY